MKLRVAGIAAVAVVLAGGVGGYWWATRDAPEIAELKEIASQSPSDELNQQVRDVVRKQVQAMPESERQNYFEMAAPVLIPLFAKQFEAQYDAFMKLSPAEQRKELDRHIDRMEVRRREAANRQGNGGGANGGPPRSGGGNWDPQRADEFQKKLVAYTTPEQRSKWQNGIQIFNNRRVERGLEPVEIGRR